MTAFVRFVASCAGGMFLTLSGADAAIVGYSAASDQKSLSLTLNSSAPYAFRRVYLDSDTSGKTGFRQGGIGAEYMIENRYLYRYTGSGSNWSWLPLGPVKMEAKPVEAAWTLSRSAIGWNSTKRSIGIVFQQENAGQAMETSAASTLTNHTVDTATVFANPERGFYRDFGANCESFALTRWMLIDLREKEGVTLLMCRINLAAFLTSPINAAALSRLNANLAEIRAAGIKTIIRPYYSTDLNVAVADRNASKEWILRHVSQLRPVFQANADVIFKVQAGFIGVFGEWWLTTDEFGDKGNVSSVQLANRKDVVDALLLALPDTKPVGVRTPRYKRNLYGRAPLRAGEAFTRTARARVGHFNDCFLSDRTDTGTYQNPDEEKAYLAAETNYVPMGGETCQRSPYSGWSNALAEMTRLRFTYLNNSYNEFVLKDWGVNIDEAKRRLGYRLSVTSSFLPASIRRDGVLKARFDVLNLGFAAPLGRRNVQLVLRNRTTGDVRRFPLPVDARTWLPAKTSRIDMQVPLVGVPKGVWDLGLALPDAARSLANRVEYSVRLANPGVWQTTSGINLLGIATVVQ